MSDEIHPIVISTGYVLLSRSHRRNTFRDLTKSANYYDRSASCKFGFAGNTSPHNVIRTDFLE